MRLIEVDQDSTPDCISPARLPTAGRSRRVFLNTSLTMPSPYFLSVKKLCDIYDKGVTNTSKNRSVNFRDNNSTEKID